MAAQKNPSCLAISLGEVAGIGPDLVLQLWLEREAYNLPPFLVVGDKKALIERAALLASMIGDVPLSSATPENVGTYFANSMPIFDIGSGGPCIPGKLDVRHAPFTIKSIQTATQFVLDGKCRALVTAPIQKSILVQDGFSHQGHTDFLGALAQDAGHEAEAVMMLAADELKVVPVTVHQSLNSVPQDLTQELIIQTAKIVNEALKRDFSIASPRLAIAALNPHAGEQGAMGTEDDTIVRPAIEKLEQMGINATGPHPADTLFHAQARQNYDAVLAMYHDQALIPIKTIAFDRAVNVTLGLPFVRTSPDHGTALNLAGTGKADPTSFKEAIKLAHKMSLSKAEII